MPWTRLDEDFGWHPKVQAAGPIAEALHVNALGYCNKYLTDGIVPVDVLPTLLNLSHLMERLGMPKKRLVVSAQTFADVLVSVGLWERDLGGQYRIHDYLTYQPSRLDVLAERQKRSDAGRAGAASRWQTHSKSHKDRKPTAQDMTMRSACPVPVPVIDPTPPTPPILAAAAAEGVGVLEALLRADDHTPRDSAFTDLRLAYPRNPDGTAWDWVGARKVWRDVVPPGQEGTCLAKLAMYAATDRVKRGYVRAPATWLPGWRGQQEPTQAAGTKPDSTFRDMLAPTEAGA